MEKYFKTYCQIHRELTYHTLDSLHLPHNSIGKMVRVGFDADESYVEVQFWDANKLIGHLCWHCGVSTELFERRFARLYISVCREIPSYCARDIYTLYAAVVEIMWDDRITFRRF